MISDSQIQAYLAGQLSAADRANFESAVTADPEALRRLIDQERLDSALRILLAPATLRQRCRSALLANILGQSHQSAVRQVMAAVQPAPPSMRRFSLFHWLTLLKNHPAKAALALAALAALVALVLALPGKRSSPTLTHQTPVVAQTNHETPVIPAPPAPSPTTATRVASQWPFAPDSLWNTPIGSAARFAPVQGPADLATGLLIVSAHIAHPIVLASTNDPIADFFIADAPTPFITTHLPNAVFTTPTASGTTLLVLPDGVTLLELRHFGRTGPNLRANRIDRTDLRGPGIPPQHLAATSSGISQMAGSLRRHELTNHIPHVVGAVIPMQILARHPGGTAHLWPATGSIADDPRLARHLAPTGNLHLGTLLAIPPSVDITQHTAPGTPARALARALQDYGLLIKDTFDGTGFVEWESAGRPHLVLCADDPWSGGNPAAISRQIAPLVRELRIVTNHGPATPGGGGTPRVPDLIPPFGNSGPSAPNLR